MIYKKTLGSILGKDEDHYYIVRNRELFNINEVGARIFDLCDGKHSEEDIIIELLSIFDISRGILENDILNYLNILNNQGLIKKV